MLLSVMKHENNKINEPEAFQLDHIFQCIMVQILYSRHKCHLGVEIMLDESIRVSITKTAFFLPK